MVQYSRHEISTHHISCYSYLTVNIEPLFGTVPQPRGMTDEIVSAVTRAKGDFEVAQSVHHHLLARHDHHRLL